MGGTRSHHIVKHVYSNYIFIAFLGISKFNYGVTRSHHIVKHVYANYIFIAFLGISKFNYGGIRIYYIWFKKVGRPWPNLLFYNNNLAHNTQYIEKDIYVAETKLWIVI